DGDCNVRLKRFTALSAVLASMIFVTMKVPAQTTAGTGTQQNSPAGTGIEEPRIKPLPDDMRYRIGPGDVLTILARKAPELSVDAVRVDQRGMIRIPMVDDEVAAACRTES